MSFVTGRMLLKLRFYKSHCELTDELGDGPVKHIAFPLPRYFQAAEGISVDLLKRYTFHIDVSIRIHFHMLNARQDRRVRPHTPHA
jgi:hypothetical protein